MRINTILAAGFAAALTANAGAALVQIDMYGSVDFNVIGGTHAGIPSGAPVHMGFQVDSDVFVNSGSFPTRGYTVIDSSFVMTVGAASVIFDNPQPSPAYFVLRNNDPAVDGFFLSPSVDLDFPTAVHIPGLTPAHELDFKVTYPGTTLSSLNILDAVGSYSFAGISVFNWGIGRFGNHGAEYVYESMTIAAVPSGGAASLLATAGLVALRRRRSA